MTNSVYLESSIKIRGHTFIHWLINKKWELILKYFLKVLTQHFWLLMFLMTTNIINFYVDVCTGYPQKMFLSEIGEVRIGYDFFWIQQKLIWGVFQPKNGLPIEQIFKKKKKWSVTMNPVVWFWQNFLWRFLGVPLDLWHNFKLCQEPWRPSKLHKVS